MPAGRRAVSVCMIIFGHFTCVPKSCDANLAVVCGGVFHKRSAVLGDGYSRNPPNRDELVAQRTQDLEGKMGQLRGFSLDGFLEDYEDGELAFPWSLPSESGPGLLLTNINLLYFANLK